MADFTPKSAIVTIEMCSDLALSQISGWDSSLTFGIKAILEKPDKPVRSQSRLRDKPQES